jgi:hypothetical protein
MNPYAPPTIHKDMQLVSVSPEESLPFPFAYWPLAGLISQGVMQIVGFFTASTSPVGLETPTAQRVMFFAFDLRVGRDPTTLVFALLGVVIFSVVLCTGVAVLLVKRVSFACNVAAAATSAMLVAAMIFHCVVPSQALSWISGVPSYFALTWLLWYSLSRNKSQHRTVAAQNRS